MSLSLTIKERAAGTGSGVSHPRYLVSVAGEKEEWLSPLQIVQRFGEVGKAQIMLTDVLNKVQKQPEVILGKGNPAQPPPQKALSHVLL